MATSTATNHSLPVAKLLLIGLVFHLVYIGSVFDCYFTSPVVHGMERFRADTAGAKRLVLIVGDGLRADLLFNLNPFPNILGSPETVAPYLRTVAETRGAFGISHTRVPTESRPGHVALIGGMYEDVSAVTRGWKTNPVHFDSVFNQSSHTFSFGSPDILPMFGQGATPGKVDMWCYHEDEEDFTKDATALDAWVLDHLRALFHNATTNATLATQLREDKTVFFLHLLGLDTTGHSYRPHSKEYMTNIQVVDTIVRQTEALFTEFYGDEDTAFVFTADHGMSVIGNHGDGDPDNTRTPLIMWGAGVREPLPDTEPSSHDEYSRPWGLSHLFRHDVAQADVAALMSAVIGVDWPVNSVGVLPDVDHTKPGYLAFPGGAKDQAAAVLVNAKVILEHYRVKHEIKRANALFYKPFPYFTEHADLEDSPGQSALSVIQILINRGRYDDARETAATLIDHTLEGLRYLETYDRTLIRIIVFAAYTGWIAYSAAHVLPRAWAQPLEDVQFLDIFSVSCLLVSYLLFALQHTPWTLYLYVVFPVYFWRDAVARLGGSVTRTFMTAPPSTLGKIFAGVIAVVAALESMVLGYTHRSIWSAGFALLGLVWPPLFWPRKLVRERPALWAIWATTCLGCALFPLQSVDKTESLGWIMGGGVMMFAWGSYLFYLYKDQISSSTKLALYAQLALIVASMAVTFSSTRSLQAKLGLPLVNQVAGWLILVAALVAPFALRTQRLAPETRTLTLFLGFAVIFVILSISVEAYFYTLYSAALLTWTQVEAALKAHRAPRPTHDKNRLVRGYEATADDVRIAVFFLFFVQVAFFGTGNVASISSFYLEPVYRLVPIFNPFLMAALLISKIVAPYIMLSVYFAQLNHKLGLPPFSLFLVALALTDVMTLTFFFNVTDTGSWLEIGQTISFFCISSLLLVWSAGICALGEWLVGSPALAPKTKAA
ncbi:GPI ethanolamine phosphate transferase 1 [Phanerochaete sordida]|uniref:GPI ethanolamine phosphate transferase 1 n=1 Tax=Phanerochaete sordida TaxID=48140 RepID=A0A9P3LIF7_9APHY|nr:GPI ethanolamine phosphate transferase 1 [Phanerochaete sordida]